MKKPVKIPKGARLALVTGASSGIGLEFSRRLAEAGVDLVMVSNQPHELDRHASDLHSRYSVSVTTLNLDLASPGAAIGVMDFLRDHALSPDILINNAGIFSFNLLADTPPAKISLFIDLHVRFLTELSILMAENMCRRRRGWILNMSSMSCWMPMPGIAMYSATKAYVRAFSRAMAYELRGSGVSMTVACPGGIATDLFGLPPDLMRLAVKIHAIQTPERFTRSALRRMFRQKQQYINGFLNRIGIMLIGLTPTHGRMLVKHCLLDKGIRKP